MPEFSHRLATQADVPNILHLIGLSIEHNMAAFLSPEQISAARETMGIDMSLINDGTYFVIETQSEGQTVLVGCGGWGKRKTLYGGDDSPTRNDELSDPAVEPARIRAMYTHPEWTRKGIGSLLIQLGERAAKAAGFTCIELGSTIPGEPLYVAKGFVEVERITRVADNQLTDTVIKMRKSL